MLLEIRAKTPQKVDEKMVELYYKHKLKVLRFKKSKEIFGSRAEKP